MQELVRKLRKAGAISHAGIGAGVHVHIGANGHTPQTLRNLANLMASHERLIADALKIDQGRMNRYCRTVNPRFIEQLNREKAHQHGTVRRHLVYGERCKLRQKSALQRQPIPYAELSMQLLQKAQLNSGYFNSTSLPTAGKTDFMPDS